MPATITATATTNNMDTIDPWRFLFAFLFVLGLIGLLAMGLKRYGRTAAGKAMLGMKNGGGRLQVVEMRYIDARRRLVLVKRDDVEHLLLLADGRELVIESRITATMMPEDFMDNE